MIRRLFVFTLACSALGAWSASWAQAYPARPVHVVIPFGPGGPDVVGRIIAAQLTTQTGQPFVVENKPGANGIVGAEYVARAAPDGYTVMVTSFGFATAPGVYKKLPYDTLKDFAPITSICYNEGILIAVNPQVPAKSLQELIAYAKKPDTRLAYGSPGIGNTLHIAGELFNLRAGIKMVHVPYKGAGPAVAALVAGEIQVMLSTPPAILAQIKGGRLRALAYSAPRRAAFLPEVPTTTEAGLPQFDMEGGWFAMFAPARTPPELVARLQREVRAALEDPQVRQRIDALGAVPVGNTPAEFAQFIDDELKKWDGVVKAAGIKTK